MDMVTLTNSFINFIIYCFMSTQFRMTLKKMASKAFKCSFICSEKSFGGDFEVVIIHYTAVLWNSELCSVILIPNHTRLAYLYFQLVSQAEKDQQAEDLMEDGIQESLHQN